MRFGIKFHPKPQIPLSPVCGFSGPNIMRPVVRVSPEHHPGYSTYALPVLDPLSQTYREKIKNYRSQGVASSAVPDTPAAVNRTHYMRF